jgi:hypothetical protein
LHHPYQFPDPPMSSGVSLQFAQQPLPLKSSFSLQHWWLLSINENSS